MKTILKTFEAFNFPWIAALIILSLTVFPPIIDSKFGTSLSTALADKDGDKGDDSDDGDSDDGESEDGDNDNGDSDDEDRYECD